MFKRLALAMLPFALAWGGGFFLVVGKTSTGLRVEAQGCSDYSAAHITARAEGIVDGRRQSLPVNLTPAGKPGAYTIGRQWPAEGKWVLLLSATSGERHTYTLVNLASREFSPRMSMQAIPPADIEAALGE